MTLWVKLWILLETPLVAGGVSSAPNVSASKPPQKKRRKKEQKERGKRKRKKRENGNLAVNPAGGRF